MSWRGTLAGRERRAQGEVLGVMLIFATVIVGTVDVDTYGEVHFDEALENRRAIPKNTKIATITYLHVTVSELSVRGG
jgi:hypothetical protein